MYIARPPFVEQLNDISFWYPILKRIGMRTPDTELFYVSNEVGKIVDGEKTSEFVQLQDRVTKAWSEFGYEAFLRTGQTSNKHDWERTCHLSKDAKIDHHLASLVEFSMIVDLPYNTFAVREMIETVAITTAFAGMPIAKEVRLFVDKGKLLCAHPYWPSEALEDYDTVTSEHLKELQTRPDMTELTKMAEYVSERFDYAWSVDFLQDIKGDWWLTDMALASSSYHWPGCPEAKQEGNDMQPLDSKPSTGHAKAPKAALKGREGES